MNLVIGKLEQIESEITPTKRRKNDVSTRNNIEVTQSLKDSGLTFLQQTSNERSRPGMSSTRDQALTILMGFLLDSISAADMVSDYFVISTLVRSRHTFWTCLNIVTITWPFFVSQGPYINFKLVHYRDTFTRN